MREAIESRGLEAIREHPSRKGQRDTFDLFVPAYNLLIEVDGDYWHRSERVKLRDAAKAARGRALGYRVERIPESLVMGEGLQEILETLLVKAAG